MDAAERTQLRDDVAREIMGWTTVDVPWAYSGDAVCWQNADGAAVVTRYAWRPDEDDRQGMQVLERLLALGFSCAAELAGAETVMAFETGDTGGVPVAHPDRRIALLLAGLAAVRGAEKGAQT